MKKLKMLPNTTSGFLITVCGLDGCGKTTMINQMINDVLRDYNVFVTKQPTNSVRNSEIFRAYMDLPNHDNFDYRSLSLLAASDRLQHVNKVIIPQMEQGSIVISDRYFYSCLANLRSRGFINDNWIYEISKFVVKPDLAFFFDVPVETAIARVRKRLDEKDRYIDVSLQYKLRDEYKKICKLNKGVLISTEVSKNESYKIVKENIERLLKSEKNIQYFKRT